MSSADPLMETRAPQGEPTTSAPNLLGRSIRPIVIESPRYTAADIVWPSFEQMREGGADIFFADGMWWRHVWQHDPARRTVGADGVLRVPRVKVRRSVWLTQEAAIKNNGDFWYVNPDGPTYGEHGLWMRNGIKPEKDPVFWYQAQLRQHGQMIEPDEIEWEAVSPAEQAQFSLDQDRLNRSTPLTPVLSEQPAPPRARSARAAVSEAED